MIFQVLTATSMKTIAFGILPRVDLLKYTDVSDVCGASIIGMTMEAVRTSETHAISQKAINE
jgi:hypothetical protein